MLRRQGDVTAIVAVNNHDSQRTVTVDLTGHGVSGTFQNLVGSRDTIAATSRAAQGSARADRPSTSMSTASAPAYPGARVTATRFWKESMYLSTIGFTSLKYGP